MAVTLVAAATAASSPHFTSSSSSSSYQIIRAAPKFQSLSFGSNSLNFTSSISQLGWNGLKHIPLITSCSSFFKSKEKKQRKRGKTVHASLFGVGAPEALVIGVVALLVFGPKGLAEIARNLGKTLRAFQPTIRELQDVSREFKSTLEREIGLDEVSPSTNMYRPPPTSFSNDMKQPLVDPKKRCFQALYVLATRKRLKRNPGSIIQSGRIIQMANVRCQPMFAMKGKNKQSMLRSQSVLAVKAKNEQSMLRSEPLLWRPTSKLTCMEDSFGVPIAWPTAKVIMGTK